MFAKPDFIVDCPERDAYLGKHAYQLMLETSEQMQVVYEARGLSFPIEVSSTLHFLLRNEGSSLAQVARGLRLQHQLVAQRVKKLEKLAFLERRADPDDARRMQLFLTERGREQAEELVACMEQTALIYRALFREIGCDLTDAIERALAAIRKNPLPLRFEDAPAEKELAQ